MLTRRVFVAGAITSLGRPHVADAQQPMGRTWRIGFLSPNSPSDPRNPLVALRQGLKELGYVESKNISIESRWAGGQYDQLPQLALELVALRSDVIVTYASPAIQATQRASKTIPIVFAGVTDPGAIAGVASLARPGGNVTGVSLMAAEAAAKQLEILKQALPRVSRIAVLGNPTNSGTAPQLRYAHEAGRALGVELLPVDTRNPGEIDAAFSKMTAARTGAVVVLVDVMLQEQRRRIATLAARHRLPSIYGLIEFVDEGGLMFYGAAATERFKRAATFVDKILKGARPGDLPIEQPTKFELAINLRTAKALGLTIPPSLLLRADQVIE